MKSNTQSPWLIDLRGYGSEAIAGILFDFMNIQTSRERPLLFLYNNKDVLLFKLQLVHDTIALSIDELLNTVVCYLQPPESCTSWSE